MPGKTLSWRPAVVTSDFPYGSEVPMFRTVADFQKSWEYEAECTLKLFRALTDRSLQQAVTPHDRTLGRIAWHIVTSVPEMMQRTGLRLSGPDENAPMPTQAAPISAA
jgi:uncharacterized damage-inducible protein DinB